MENMFLEQAAQPAFPITTQYVDAWGNPKAVQYIGLSKREMFAAMAMQSLMGVYREWTNSYELSNVAVKYADALLEKLNDEE